MARWWIGSITQGDRVILPLLAEQVAMRGLKQYSRLKERELNRERQFDSRKMANKSLLPISNSRIRLFEKGEAHVRQQKRDKTMAIKINPSTLNHWSWIFCCVIFISISLRPLVSFWGDTSWFLFEIGRYSSRGLPDVEGSRVWQASHGVRHLFTVAAFTAAGLIHAVKLIRLRRVIPSSERQDISVNTVHD